MCSLWWQQAGCDLALESGRIPLLQEVVSFQAGASISLSDFARVGVTMPVHLHVRYADTVVTPGLFDANKGPPVYGDLSFWAVTLILDSRKKAIGLAWYIQVDAATGTPELYLGDPQGGVDPAFAVSRRIGDWELLANVGARFRNGHAHPRDRLGPPGRIRPRRARAPRVAPRGEHRAVRQPLVAPLDEPR